MLGRVPALLALFASSFPLAAAAASSTTLSVQRSMCLDVKDGGTANGAAVQLWSCAQGNSNQQWAFTGGALRSSNGKCLDVKDGVLANGRSLQLWDCVPGSANQAWTMSNGAIKHSGSNYCVDVTGGVFGNGTPLQIWNCAQGSVNQAWSQGASAAASTQNSQQVVVSGPAAVNPSGYLQTSGTQIVDKNNSKVLLRGTNIGGWLVLEGWMNGYTDASDKDPFRFSLETLERRFGEQTAAELVDVWRDNFFNSSDLDFLKTLGINAIRVPFGNRNLQHADGSWITNSAGNVDFTRLDWVVGEAAKRGIYTILDFHMWTGQQDDYSLISQNSDAGRAQQAQAAAIWTQVAKHFKGNANVAAFDAINEPTGSYANMLQDALYKAIRAVDADRIIFMEAMSANPASMGWRQVSYSVHQYGMMGADFAQNKALFQKDSGGTLASFKQFNIPTYIGEFMVQENGDMLSWLLGQYNANSLHWTSWTYKTVDLGAWGLCNLPSRVKVDVLHDSASTIKSHWQNLGSCTPETAVVNAFKKALQ